MDTNLWRFLSGCLGGDSPPHLFCAAEFASQTDAGSSNSAFSVYFRDRWFRYGATPDWTVVSIASTKYVADDRWVVVALGARGQVWELYPKGPVEAMRQLPFEGEFTQIAAVGDELVAVGMGRACLVRDAAGNWSDLSAPWPDPAEGVIGFTDVGGPTFEQCTAVGWSGEVWFRRNGAWMKQDSPTNENLNAIDVGVDGTFFCAGDNGVLVKYSEGVWNAFDTGVDENLLDVCVHGGIVFSCSSSAVYRLVDGELINDFAGDGDDVPRTCAKLLSDGDAFLYSVGTHDVFRRSSDGWERLA